MCVARYQKLDKVRNGCGEGVLKRTGLRQTGNVLSWSDAGYTLVAKYEGGKGVQPREFIKVWKTS